MLVTPFEKAFSKISNKLCQRLEILYHICKNSASAKQATRMLLMAAASTGIAIPRLYQVNADPVVAFNSANSVMKVIDEAHHELSYERMVFFSDDMSRLP
ncbi:MAG: hypothetical protein H6672_02110 [Anaerolineaceae bacterium]|nr:hypothetical protein [Anaerolineaceae bacterium]